MSQTKLAEAVAFMNTDEFKALPKADQDSYISDDRFAFGYAWGALDNGHPPIVSLTEGVPVSTTDTAWAFGALYARMLLDLKNHDHPRNSAHSIQDAWVIFVQTGCPEGYLPERLGRR